MVRCKRFAIGVVHYTEGGSMRLDLAVLPKRKQLMLQTPEQQRNCARMLIKLGYRYIVGWKDVAGYGLMAVQFADWQTPSSTPYVNL